MDLQQGPLTIPNEDLDETKTVVSPQRGLLSIPNEVLDEAATFVDECPFTEDPMDLFRKNYRVEATISDDVGLTATVSTVLETGEGSKLVNEA